MPIEYKKNQAHFLDVATVEEAEPLLTWLQERKAPKVHLNLCTHMHSANLQVLMAAKDLKIVSWPEDQRFRAWLEGSLFAPLNLVL
jgi:hypothetical protein